MKESWLTMKAMVVGGKNFTGGSAPKCAALSFAFSLARIVCPANQQTVSLRSCRPKADASAFRGKRSM